MLDRGLVVKFQDPMHGSPLNLVAFAEECRKIRENSDMR